MYAAGPKSFWVGYLPCILRAAPANSATFFAYQSTMKLLKKMDEE